MVDETVIGKPLIWTRKGEGRAPRGLEGTSEWRGMEKSCAYLHGQTESS